MKKFVYIISILIILAIFSALGFFYWQKSPKSSNNAASPTVSSSIKSTLTPLPSLLDNSSILALPISKALERVTKKPFGLFVSPGHSPISLEKFTGFHTGVDFETLLSEANIDVPIFAACTGPMLLKKWATGYGGVAVQQCDLAGQAVTIIYGHLRLASIKTNINENLSAGEQFAVLGTGYSTETDGERKHLHFGIHKGTQINLLGYVQNESELSGWLNALNYLR